VRLVIAPAKKMNIICRDQSDAKIPRNLRQRCHAFALFFHSVIVGCAVLQLARDNAEARAEAKMVLRTAAAFIRR